MELIAKYKKQERETMKKDVACFVAGDIREEKFVGEPKVMLNGVGEGVGFNFIAPRFVPRKSIIAILESIGK